MVWQVPDGLVLVRAQKTTENAKAVISCLENSLPGWMGLPEVLGEGQEGVHTELDLVSSVWDRQELWTIQKSFQLPSVNAAYWQETRDGLSSIGITDWLHFLRDKLQQMGVAAYEGVPLPVAVTEDTQGDDNTEGILDEPDEWTPKDGVELDDLDIESAKDDEVFEYL